MKRIVPPLSLLGALFFGVLGGMPIAQAGVIVANGVKWELTSAAQPGVDKTGLFTLSATMNPGWTGDQAWLGAFSLKNFGSGSVVQVTSPITSSAGGLWGWTNEDLNANGCKENGTDDALCIYLTNTLPGTGNLVETALGGASPSTAGDFSFSFQLSATDFLPSALHLKVNWWQEDCKTQRGVTTCDGWKKVEDLISRDVSYYTPPGGGPDGDPDDEPNPVPLPGTLALLGIGLLGLRATRRRAD